MHSILCAPSEEVFFVPLTVLPLQGFEVAHPIFDDVANTVARCFSPLSAKRQFLLPNVFEKRQIGLIWQ